MAIYKGDKELVGLYKGSTEIVKRYKGSNVIYEAFKWLPYSYEYIYNSLVPSVISDKNVKDKAQVNTIYGNSVVENQLVKNGDFTTSEEEWRITTTDATATWETNKLTVRTTRTGGDWTAIYQYVNGLRLNDKYYLKIKHTKSSNCALRLRYPQIIAISDEDEYIVAGDDVSQGSLFFQVQSTDGQEATLELTEIAFINLTQWYPFNTPTTLTDTRVQSIINRGHIPYNPGTLKSVNICEISSEPYNLFDGELEQGGLTQGIANTYSSFVRSKNFIPVISGGTYTLVESETSNKWKNRYVAMYDKDYNWIRDIGFGNNAGGYGKPTTLTLDSNCFHIKFYYYAEQTITPNDFSEICFHKTGTRTGYAPHTKPQTLPFKYQGSGVGTSHDTMEIGTEDVVFTKAINMVDLGTLSWYYKTSNGRMASTGLINLIKLQSAGYTIKPNIICSKYTTDTPQALESASPTNMTISIGGNGTDIYIYDNAYTDAELFKQSLSGVILYYELATPQVICIPKKHLGIIDLGSLTWWANAAGGFSSNAIENIRYIGTTIQPSNISTNKYPTLSLVELTNGTFGISLRGSNDIWIKDNTYATANELKQALQGVILYYETLNEVSVIPSIVDIEAGGSVTTNWFSWVENQLAHLDRATSTIDGITFTKIDDITFTLDGTANADITNLSMEYNYREVNTSHKYLIRGIEGGSSSTYYYSINRFADIFNAGIYSPTSNGSSRINLTIRNGTTFNNQVFNLQIIDLTVGFGEGNEPTSINDPRIQYIVEQGYIPTNTTGTTRSIASEVLPNIDFKIKCR